MLRFPPDPQNPSKPDFCAKPIFALLVYTGGNDVYEPFDELYMDDEEWEQCVFPFVPLAFSYYSYFSLTNVLYFWLLFCLQVKGVRRAGRRSDCGSLLGDVA